jgi:hypothetical protein
VTHACFSSELFAVLTPAEVLSAVAALTKLISGLSAVCAMPDKDGDNRRFHVAPLSPTPT